MLKRILLNSAFGLFLAAGAASCAEVVVTVRPPAAIVETRPVRPGPRYVWIAGYHRWDPAARAYVWEKGRWELPPAGRRRWVAHRWVRHGDHWVFVEGGWR